MKQLKFNALFSMTLLFITLTVPRSSLAEVQQKGTQVNNDSDIIWSFVACVGTAFGITYAFLQKLPETKNEGNPSLPPASGPSPNGGAMTFQGPSSTTVIPNNSPQDHLLKFTRSHVAVVAPPSSSSSTSDTQVRKNGKFSEIMQKYKGEIETLLSLFNFHESGFIEDMIEQALASLIKHAEYTSSESEEKARLAFRAALGPDAFKERKHQSMAGELVQEIFAELVSDELSPESFPSKMNEWKEKIKLFNSNNFEKGS